MPGRWARVEQPARDRRTTGADAEQVNPPATDIDEDSRRIPACATRGNDFEECASGNDRGEHAGDKNDFPARAG